MILGFTGTRLGPRPAQHESLKRFIQTIAPTKFLHGDGGHSDAIAHGIVASFFPNCFIHVFPSTFGGGSITYQGSTNRIRVYDPMPALDRNRVIVKHIHGLIACPQRDTEDWAGSGTWATVRYAREIGCPIYIIRGNGLIVRDEKFPEKYLPL